MNFQFCALRDIRMVARQDSRVDQKKDCRYVFANEMVLALEEVLISMLRSRVMANSMTDVCYFQAAMLLPLQRVPTGLSIQSCKFLGETRFRITRD